MEFEEYKHHGKKVFVRKNLKGKHIYNCIFNNRKINYINNPAEN